MSQHRSIVKGKDLWQALERRATACVVKTIRSLMTHDQVKVPKKGQSEAEKMEELKRLPMIVSTIHSQRLTK